MELLAKPEGVPRYLTVNADESEPGTFKDRAILESDPHMLIEGILIASYALGVHQAFVYIRGEFHLPEVHLSQAVEEAYAKGVIVKNVWAQTLNWILSCTAVRVRISAAKRPPCWNRSKANGAIPVKPPFPAVSGLFGCPTIINNVETIANVPWILANGGAAYAALGTKKALARACSASVADVNKPGVYEEELGIPLMTLINENGGGVRGDKKLKAVIPGGSTPCFDPH